MDVWFTRWRIDRTLTINHISGDGSPRCQCSESDSIRSRVGDESTETQSPKEDLASLASWHALMRGTLQMIHNLSRTDILDCNDRSTCEEGDTLVDRPRLKSSDLDLDPNHQRYIPGDPEEARFHQTYYRSMSMVLEHEHHLRHQHW